MLLSSSRDFLIRKFSLSLHISPSILCLFINKSKPVEGGLLLGFNSMTSRFSEI